MIHKASRVATPPSFMAKGTSEIDPEDAMDGMSMTDGLTLVEPYSCASERRVKD